MFDKAGHYLYHIPTPPYPIGLGIYDEFIYVTTDEQKLVKIQISNRKTIKSVVTEKWIYGMDISNKVYVCENDNNSVSVFSKDLNFLERIPLKSLHVTSRTPYSIKLFENNMYVMCIGSDYCIQVFSQDGTADSGYGTYK